MEYQCSIEIDLLLERVVSLWTDENHAFKN